MTLTDARQVGVRGKAYISPANFDKFTYSKRSHFRDFISNGYDEELFRKDVDPLNCDLKVYQDLFMFTFIKHNIPPRSRILDIGGGDSRILRHFRNIHECWNIDKLEGVGNGPTNIDTSSFRIVYDYMGNFSDELPDNYFDLVFSISTLEHVPAGEPETYKNIMNDINRVLKPGGFSVHCIDVVLKDEYQWTNDVLPFFFENAGVVNKFIPLHALLEDSDLFHMSEKYFERSWKVTTGKSFSQFGRPVSYNLMWVKDQTAVKMREHSSSKQNPVIG